MLCLVLLGAAFLFCAQNAFAGTPPPTPRPTRLPTPLPGGGMFPAWMTPPASGPSLADAGAALYYDRCMACHGDQGQGLTVQWRAQWDVEHQDCSRSTCHGARHPPEGFTFPKNFAPALVGANALTRFANAQALYDFIRARMPYQAPGSLTTKEYWQLVAFLLQRRGVHVGQIDEQNAASIALTPAPLQSETRLPVIAFGGAILVGIGAVIVWRERKRFK